MWGLVFYSAGRLTENRTCPKGAQTPLSTQHHMTKDRGDWLLNQYKTYTSAEISSDQLSPAPHTTSASLISTSHVLERSNKAKKKEDKRRRNDSWNAQCQK
ncbi:hypothetical protein J6590_078995 [Homalodisca vitripennis]|nr:hypothetical protein J6590_078995 [Homalodisca vitripennis]